MPVGRGSYVRERIIGCGQDVYLPRQKKKDKSCTSPPQWPSRGDHTARGHMRTDEYGGNPNGAKILTWIHQILERSTQRMAYFSFRKRVWWEKGEIWQHKPHA